MNFDEKKAIVILKYNELYLNNDYSDVETIEILYELYINNIEIDELSCYTRMTVIRFLDCYDITIFTSKNGFCSIIFSDNYKAENQNRTFRNVSLEEIKESIGKL